MIQNKVQFREFLKQAALLIVVLFVCLLIPLCGAIFVLTTKWSSNYYFAFYVIFMGPLFLLLCAPLMFMQSIFFWPLVLAVYQSVWTARHRRLLTLLLTSQEAQIPLAPMIREYSYSCFSPYYAKNLRFFANALEQGYSIKDALTKSPGIMRADFVAMLDAAPNDPKTLQSIESALEEEKINYTTQPNLFVRMIYLLGIVYMFVTIAFFIFVFITPKFGEIFYSFDTSFPPLTQFVLNLGRLFYALALPLFFFSALFFLWVCFMIFIHTGLMRWRPIGLRRLFRNMDNARLLRILGTGLRKNVPLQKLMYLYNWSVSWSGYLRNRGKKIDRQLAEGHPWIQTLHKENVITAREVPILESAQQVGNLPSALEDLAMSKMRKQSNDVDDLSKVIYFIMLSVLAVMVGVFVISMFLPLIKLIQSLS